MFKKKETKADPNHTTIHSMQTEKELMQHNINEVAGQLAAKFAYNPHQAAFIFDRIFLRKENLDPERQFKIVDEDLGEDAGLIVRAIHAYYLNLNVFTEKEAFKNYALEKFIAEFNKHNIDFMQCYDTPAAFNSVVGRINPSFQEFPKPSRSSDQDLGQEGRKPFLADQDVEDDFISAGFTDVLITALYNATQWGDESRVALLLNSNAELINPPELYKNLQPIVKLAIKKRHQAIAIRFLEKYPVLGNPSTSNTLTSLHLAIINQCDEVLNKLIAMQIDLDCLDEYNQTPLCMAAYMGLEEIVEKLIDHGANPSMAVQIGGQRVTPFEIAAGNGQVNVVAVFLKYYPSKEELRKMLHLTTINSLHGTNQETRNNLKACATLIHSHLSLYGKEKIMDLNDATPILWSYAYKKLFAKQPTSQDANPRTKDEAIRAVLASFLKLLYDPRDCLPYLHYISDLLDTAWKNETNRPFPKFDKSTVDSWAHEGRIWPIPNEHFKPTPIKKDHMLSRVLLDVLQQHGMGEDPSKWSGFLEEQLANLLLVKNAFFTENRRTINGLFHGNMHNIQRVILLLAVLSGAISLAYTNEQGQNLKLSVAEVLAALIRDDLRFDGNKKNSWSTVLDWFSLTEMNFTQPHLLQAFILMAKELENTILQEYMLWSFCRQFNEMRALHNHIYRTHYTNQEICEELISKFDTHLFGTIPPEFAIQRQEKPLEQVACIDEIKKEEMRKYAVHPKKYAPLQQPTELPNKYPNFLQRLKISSKSLTAEKVAYALWLMPKSDDAKVKTQLSLFSLWAKNKIPSSEKMIAEVKTHLANKYVIPSQ